MVYHVRITKKSDKWNDCLEFDLSRDELLKKIIEPYHKGKKFICSGEVIDPFDIDKIKINETLEKSSVLIPKIKAKRRQSTTATPISDEWYVTEEGKDVTSKFIKYPPKRKGKSKKSNKKINIRAIIILVISSSVILGSLYFFTGKIDTDGFFASLTLSLTIATSFSNSIFKG